MRNPLFLRYYLLLQVLPLVVLAVLAKLAFLRMGWDIMPMSSLVGTVVSAGVFLLGFLVSGLLPDYKEAEKIPGEMSATLDAMADEALIMWENKKAPVARDYLAHLRSLASLLDSWLHKKDRTRTVMDALRGMNRFYAAFEEVTQANFITRMKQEQNVLRKMVIRVHTIRETTFIASAYVIAECFTGLIVLMLLLTDLGPLTESLFFVAAISFLLTYMIGLIKDLDNPFHYHQNRHLDDEIAVEPLRIVEQQLGKKLAEIDGR